MSTSNTFPKNSSPCRFFLLFTLTLFAFSAIVYAQGNTNTNSNTSNTNVNPNRNSTTTANTNGNANSNQNGNANSNLTGESKQSDSGAVKSGEELTKSWLFFSLVTLLFASILGPFIYAITRAILFSKATFRSPLGLPEGSLRAVLAFMLVAFLGFYVYASILSMNANFKPPDFLIGVVATVIGFYFGSRANEAGGTAPRRTATVEGNVTDKTGAPAPGASVELSQAGVKKFTQTADTNGKFKVDNVPVGEYEIRASLQGHAPSDAVKVKVPTDPAQPVTLKLK